MNEVINVKCKECGREHPIELSKLIMCEDMILDNRVSAFSGFFNDCEDGLCSMVMTISDYPINCRCGMEITIKYNTKNNFYLMIQNNKKQRFIWEEFIYFSPITEGGCLIPTSNKEPHDIDTLD